MIRKMQRQFVVIAVGAVALLLAVFLLALNLVNLRTTVANVCSTARMIAERGGQLRETTEPETEELTAEAPFRLRYFSVRVAADGSARAELSHIASVDAEQAVGWARQLMPPRRAEGVVRRGRLFYAYHREDRETGSLIVFLDCTAEMRANLQLRRHSVIFGLLTLLLFAAVIALLSGRVVEPFQRSMQSQEQFITNAGHELKTPLAIISADTEFLEMTAGESEWTESIRNQVARMTALVNRLIRLAKLSEREKVELEELDLGGIVKETAEAFAPLSAQQGKEIRCETEDNVRGFATRDGYAELVSILLDNAVKYCDEAGEIVLTLKRRGRAHGSQLRVTNPYAEGAGLDMSRFFDRFYRADESHSSLRKGYGIGLSMAEGLVREFHGRIAAEYRDGVIAFVVTLP